MHCSKTLSDGGVVLNSDLIKACSYT
jgi:hypothetical protein